MAKIFIIYGSLMLAWSYITWDIYTPLVTTVNVLGIIGAIWLLCKLRKI